MVTLLIKGAKEPQKVLLETSAQCTVLRRKLHMLRAAMRREQHYALRAVERVEVVIRPVSPQKFKPSDPHYCVVQPANSEFLDALRQAGIEAQPEPPVEITVGVTEPSLPSLEDFDYGSVLDRPSDDEDDEEVKP